MFRQGLARFRNAGLAWLVMETLCTACFGRHGSERHDVVGQAWQGLERRSRAGMACPGGARSGRVWQARRGITRFRNAPQARHGTAGLIFDRFRLAGLAWLAMGGLAGVARSERASQRLDRRSGEVTTAR